MAKCSNCGAEGTRIRSRWNDDGQLPDECPSCAPESFEKFTAPSDKKIWMGFEAHPEQYVKKHDEKTGEIFYERKPEYRAEQEQRLASETVEEADTRRRAEAAKRENRRTLPMDDAELSAALRKAEMIADWMASAAAQGRDVN